MQHTYFVLCMRHPSWRSQLAETTSSYLNIQKHWENHGFNDCTKPRKKMVFNIPIGNTSIPRIPRIAPCEPNDATCASQASFETLWDDFKLPENSKTHRKTMVSMTAPCHAQNNKWFLTFQLEIHRFHWSQASHHVRRMMQPVRVKTSFATLWHHFKLPELANTYRKPWFQWPHHATPKKRLGF